MMRAVLPALLLFALPAAAKAVTVCNATWTDPARQRAVPVRIRMPDGGAKVPVVLFSYGLGGSLDSGTDWTNAWAEAGIASVTIQHPGSDRAILATGIATGMSPMQLVARVQDVHYVIDELGRRKREGACDLARIDLSKLGMSGHSFGAITTQATSGQHYPLAAMQGIADPRIKAAIAFSPSPPMRGNDDAAAFGTIHIPFFSITGTADVVPITPNISAADRQRPFRAMPAGGKYLLVLAGASHMQFNGQDVLRNGMAPDPHVRAVTIAATTAFWKATLMQDQAATDWLTRGGLQAMLTAGDSFEMR